MTKPLPPLGISWVLSTISGYGIYGLQIILQYLRRGGDPSQLILMRKPAVTMLPPLAQARVEQMFTLATKIQEFNANNPQEDLCFRHPVLHGCGSDFAGFAWQDKFWGQPNIGCAAIEHLVCTQHGRDIAKNYQKFIAISKWNADYLKSLDVGPVHLCYQGIDASLFYPGPSSGLYKDRFVIFSGGKFEFRKAQDIVTAAFKRFYARHPEALLVTAWQNLLGPDAQAFERAGLANGVPEMAPEFGLHITPWLLKQGLPPGSFIDLPFTHNMLMPSVLRECDMAVFPNRCEGGTNLVAMEAMACGVPTYVSYNTGHKDLVDLIGCGALRDQRAVKPSISMQTVQDWGEGSVDEVYEAMERVYTQRDEAKKQALALAPKLAADWEWGGLNDKLLDAVYEGL